MIRPLKFLPTVFKVTPAAKELIAKRQDDAYLYLGVEVLRATFEPTFVRKESFIQKLFSKKMTKTQLTVLLDKNTNDDLVLATERRINKLLFEGKKIPIDMQKIVQSSKETLKVVLESKEGILNQLNFIKRH